MLRIPHGWMPTLNPLFDLDSCIAELIRIIENNTPEVFFNNPKEERTKTFLNQILKH